MHNRKVTGLENDFTRSKARRAANVSFHLEQRGTDALIVTMWQLCVRPMKILTRTSSLTTTGCWHEHRGFSVWVPADHAPQHSCLLSASLLNNYLLRPFLTVLAKRCSRKRYLLPPWRGEEMCFPLFLSLWFVEHTSDLFCNTR